MDGKTGEKGLIRRYCPSFVLSNYSKKDLQHFFISGIAFNEFEEVVATYSREDVYLFNMDDRFVNEKNSTKDNVVTETLQRYTGRRNVQTFCKNVVFLHDNHYVATGSDCGNFFIWEKKSGQVRIEKPFAFPSRKLNNSPLLLFILCGTVGSSVERR
jgi:hypothetical protein